jgi:hypothetical protein
MGKNITGTSIWERRTEQYTMPVLLGIL